MKTVLIIICFVALSFTGKAQYKKDSTDMSTRLETFMQYNRLMDIDKVLDYTYPKLFTIAPREQVKEAMENAFSNDELIINLDSVSIVKIYPVFAFNENMYSKIIYSMTIYMELKDELKDTADTRMFLKIMQDQYGEENVTIDNKRNGINIFQQVDMAAIKDEFSPEWTFVNLKKDDPLLEMLFEKDLIARFNSY